MWYTSMVYVLYVDSFMCYTSIVYVFYVFFTTKSTRQITMWFYTQNNDCINKMIKKNIVQNYNCNSATYGVFLTEHTSA